MKVQTPDMEPEGRPAVSTLELYSSVWRYAAGGRARYLFAMLLLVGAQTVKLLVPWLAGRAIDTVQTSGTEHIGRAALITVAIFLVYVLAWSMHGPGRIIERNVGLRVRAGVADALYAKLASLPLAWHETHHSADMQQRAKQASSALSDFAQSQFLYLQNIVNVIGPLVALSLLSPWTGALAFLGYIAVATVIIRFDRQIVRLVHRQNVLERRYAVRLLDFLGNIGTVLSLRLSNVSRRLVGQRLIEVFEPTRRMIALTEAKWCAVDLLTVALSWLLVGVYVWRMRSEAPAGAPLLLGGVFMVYQYAQQAGGVIGAMAANLQNFSRFRADYASANSLPQKWSMPLSERGINLSGGQRQRLSLARGLLAGAHSSLLLLDEPTSALDQATEATVFERLRAGLPDRCLIASIHRLSALVYFNRVIVMAEGRVVDSGTVSEILERQPAFREVVYSAAHGTLPAPEAVPRTVH